MSHKITRRKMDKVKKGFAFHMYPDRLIEWCMDYDAWVEGIKLCTPKDELELRLRLFKLIPPEKIPARLAKAWLAYTQALNKKKNWNTYKIVKKNRRCLLRSTGRLYARASSLARRTMSRLPLEWVDNLQF